MAEHIDDVVYTDESKEMFNIVNILIIAWIVLGMIVYIVARSIVSSSKKSSEKNPHKVHSNGETSSSRDKSEKASRLAPGKREDTSSKNQSLAASVKEAEVIVSTATTSSFNPFYESLETSNIPQTYGTNKNAVAWANKVLNWIYQTTPTSQPIIMESILSAINKKTRELALEYGILIEADQSPVADSNSGAPSFSNLYTTLDAKGNVVTTVKCEMHHLPLNLLVTQLKDNQKLSLHYKLVLNSLKGKLKAEYIVAEYQFLLRFTGNPEVGLSLKPVDDTLPDSHSLEVKLKHMLLETLNTLELEMRFDREKDFPIYKKPSTAPGSSPAPTKTDSNQHKLLVRIIRANNLGGNKGSKAPYCVLELDEPSQRFETTTWKETSNPAWNEMFYFTVGPNSEDLLLELYDDSKKPPQDNFLGLGIVSLAELISNPRQKHEIVLENRPNEKSEDVTGQLTVEFLLNEGEDFPHLGVGQGKIIETNSRKTATGTIITTTTIKRANQNEELPMNNGEVTDEEQIEARSAIPEAAAVAYDQQIGYGEEEKDAIVILKINSYKQEDEDKLVSPISLEKESSSSEASDPNKTILNDQIQLTEEEASTLITNGDVSAVISPNDPLLEDSVKKEPLRDDDGSLSVPKLENPTSSATDNDQTPVNNETSHSNDHLNSFSVESLPLTVPNDASKEEETISVKTITPLEVEPEQLVDTEANGLPDEEAPSRGSQKPEDEVGGSLADMALKQIEAKEKNGHPSKTTLIIHKVQRPLSPSEETLVPQPSDDPSDSIVNDDNASSAAKPKEKGTLMQSFRGLRKKLSFKSHRSRSVDKYNKNGDTQINGGRSVSSDRSQSNATTPKQGIKSFLTVRPKTDTNGDQSSMSGASGFSGASNHTFVNESSTLMVESIENGVTKRFIVPPALAQKSKWRKLGTKLHVFNNHTFIATHLTGSELCQVCRLAITRRFGKQGYVCRDCHMVCHKPCHIKAEGFCTSSTINKLEAEYIRDPKFPKLKTS